MYMKRIIKDICLTVSLITSLLMTTTSPAESLPPSMPSCAPCGSFPANAGPLPADAGGVNPICNYTATTECRPCRGYFGGFYLGAGYGFGWIDYNLRIAGADLVSGTSNRQAEDTASYLLTNFNGGFNLVLDHFLLGVELGYNLRSRTNPFSYYDLNDSLALVDPVTMQSITVMPCKIRLNINSYHAASADLLPGFVYNRFIVYLRLGVEQEQFTWHRRACFPAVTLDLTDGPDIIVAGQEFVDSQKKTGTGYRAGIGFGIAAGCHVSFHLNYIHVFNDTFTFTPDVNRIPTTVPVIIPPDADAVPLVVLSQFSANNTLDPQRNEVIFGVKFRF